LERKAHNSLNEAALQVQLNEAKSIMGGPRVARTVNQQQQGVISKHKKNLSNTQANLDRSGVPANAPIRQNVRNTAASQMSTAASRMTLKAGTWDELDIPDMVLEYFNNYFDGDLNEDTSNEDIMQAVHDLIDLAEAVCDAVGIDEAFTRHASSDTSRKVDVVPGKSKVDVNRNFNRKVFGDKEYIKPSPEQLRTALAAQAEFKNPVLIVKGTDKWGGHIQQKKITGQDIRNKARDRRIAKIANRTRPMGK